MPAVPAAGMPGKPRGAPGQGARLCSHSSRRTAELASAAASGEVGEAVISGGGSVGVSALTAQRKTLPGRDAGQLRDGAVVSRP